MLITALREGLCLDYANTLSWRGRPEPAESLGDVTALIDWVAGAIAIGTKNAQELKQWSRGHTEPAARLFASTIAIREAIYEIFSALSQGDAASERNLATLNEALGKAPARNRLARRDGDYGWQFEQSGISAPALLAPVLWSAGDLVVRREHRRIRQCANDKCLWLFVDESKSGTRRWCDMASCGNRAKASRHYLRHRAVPDSRKKAPGKG